ncbi:MAG: Hsp20/alpha crystallin family protein [Candidatus Obscuribacterales bacterium]|nr:Hsp20/alpha crystallin family protein [Candidatus Obscuribacterales bacterium]
MFYNKSMNDYRAQIRRPLTNTMFNDRIDARFNDRFESTQYVDHVSRNSHLNHLNHVNHLNHSTHLGQFGQATMWQEQYLGYETPDTDILELDDQYVLEVALPGVCLDDIELKIEDSVLSVIAKRTPAMFEEKAAILRKEMAAGLLVREFEFETEILAEQIEARLERGILFISIPKVEVALRIPVSAGTLEGHMNTLKTRVNKTELHQNRKEVAIK